MSYWSISQAPRELKQGEGLALSQQQPRQNEHRGPKCPMESPLNWSPQGPGEERRKGPCPASSTLSSRPFPKPQLPYLCNGGGPCANPQSQVGI